MSRQDPVDRAAAVAECRAALSELRSNMTTLKENRAQLKGRLDLIMAKSQITVDCSEANRLRISKIARLEAKLESLPVIEQAKGILMCRSGCGSEEAFEVLRRASQRTNVRVKDLAAQIVAGSPRSTTLGQPTDGSVMAAIGTDAQN